jgi:hypothetical protein
MTQWFLLDTGWGCGGIEVNINGVIIHTTPIFWRLKGIKFKDLPRKYRTYAIN